MLGEGEGMERRGGERKLNGRKGKEGKGDYTQPYSRLCRGVGGQL